MVQVSMTARGGWVPEDEEQDYYREIEDEQIKNELFWLEAEQQRGQREQYVSHRDLEEEEDYHILTRN